MFDVCIIESYSGFVFAYGAANAYDEIRLIDDIRIKISAAHGKRKA